MTSSQDMIRGRSNVVTLTNNSGGALVAGDVCIQDTSGDEYATTTTSANSTAKVFIAAESIASGATGKFYSSGYCPLVTPSASVTRGRYLFTHTVAKQAAENATYGTGAFGIILESGTTPSAYLFTATAQGSGGGVTRSGSTTDEHLAVWNGSDADSIKDGGAVPAAAAADGWTAGTGTWSYSSADAPTFVISVNNDQTAIIGVGMRIKLTQTSAKHFIVTAVGAYSGGATLITVYGGTDYTLVSAAITSPYYSTHKAPFGFPLSPVKWTVEVTDTAINTQATPSANTWYNIGSTTISIPIGAWRTSYKTTVQFLDSSESGWSVKTTLSTANNSESDVDFTAHAGGSSWTGQQSPMGVEKYLVLAAKTSYYLNAEVTNDNMDNIYLRGDLGKTILRAVCAYL